MILLVLSKQAAYFSTCQHILCLQIQLWEFNESLAKARSTFPGKCGVADRFWKSILSRHSCMSLLTWSTPFFFTVPANLWTEPHCRSESGEVSCLATLHMLRWARTENLVNWTALKHAWPILGRHRFQSLSLHHPVSCCWNLNQSWQARDQPLWNLHDLVLLSLM